MCEIKAPKGLNKVHSLLLKVNFDTLCVEKGGHNMANHFSISGGHIVLNGVEISEVSDVKVHIEGSGSAEVILKFDVPIQDVRTFGLPTQLPERQ